MNELRQKHWFWILIAAVVIGICTAIWGGHEIAKTIVGILMAPGFFLIKWPLETLDLGTFPPSKESPALFPLLALSAMFTTIWAAALIDIYRALRGEEIDREPRGAFGRFIVRFKLWIPLVRYFRNRNRVR